MAVSFPSNPSDGDEFVSNNQRWIYDAIAGIWQKLPILVDVSNLTDTQSLLPAQTLKTHVYNTLGELPTSGPNALSGQTAFVTSENKLFISTGGNWRAMTLTKQNPVLTSTTDGSGGISPFTLATDGSVTVITMTASHPDGLPLIYSYNVVAGSLTNGGGTTATIEQGTGAQVNQFFITPNTDAAYNGSFTVEFSVSDGEATEVSVGEFTLTIGGGATYTISGATYSGSVSASGNARRFFIYNADGTKMFTCDGGIIIKEHSLSTAYDISTANWTYTAQSSNLTNITAASIDGGDFSADGTTLIVCHQISSPDGNDITQYDLTTAFDISTITSHTAVLDTRPAAGVSIGGAAAVQFGDNGNKLFALLNYPDLVMEYALSTPYDISTASFTTSFNFKTATGADNLLEMQFNSSGTKLLMTDNQNDRLYQIDLSTGFDLNTAAYNNNFINFSTIDTIPQALKFNDDESKLYVAGGQNKRIYTFDLVQE